MDDWELLEQYRTERAQHAFAELVARHAGLVYGVCRRRLRDEHLAEDLTQAVFLILARRPPTPRGQAALAGWLYQTAVYACMNATRAQRIRGRHERAAAQDRDESVPFHAASEGLELAEEMDEAPSRLPARDRDALLLRYYRGLTLGAVGQALGVTEDTAAKRLSRALERLRRALATTRGGASAGASTGAGAAPISAVAAGQVLARLTQSPAPPALAAKLAGIGAGEVVVSAAIEQAVNGALLMMKQAQLKLAAALAAVVIVVGGGSLAAVATVGGWWSSSSPPAVSDNRRNSAAANNGNDANRLTEEGWALWRQQRYAEAAEKFQQALALNPGASEAWNGLGWASLHAGEYERVRPALEKVLELRPDHPGADNGLGHLSLLEGKLDEAERHFLKCADRAPPAAYGLARVYLLRGKWDESRHWLDRALASGQFDDDELVQRIAEAIERRKLDDGLRATITPRRSSPSLALVQRGWNLAREGNLDQADAAMSDALARAPDEPQVLSGVGWFRLNRGHTDEARELFERALALSPGDPVATNGLAHALKRQGRVDEAIALWQKLVDHAPETGHGIMGLAQTYLEQDEFDKALPLFERLALQMPDNEAVQAGLDRAREGAKR
jgi:RNA polymerase sigma factor (sigma-70 family)